MNTSCEQEQECSVELHALPAGWSWASLGELGLVRLGKTPRKSDYRDSGEHKIVKFRDVDEHGHVDWHNPIKGFVDSAPEVIRTLKDLQKDDVLVTASAHMSEHIGKKVGIVANIPGQFRGAYVVGEILQVRAREDIEPKWILYYLRSTDGYKAIQRRVHGVHLISSRAQNIEIPVAPLDQQKRIVAEIEKQFSRLDEAVANLKRVKANLKRYKAAVLKAAVEGRLVETEAEFARREGRSYETGEQLLQRILETRRSQWQGKGKYKEPAAPDTTDLPELPEGWTWCGFEQVSISDKHALKAGPFGSALKKEMYVESGYKVYGQEQVISGDPTFGDYFIDEAKYRELESCAVKPGDLLISLVGTAGKVLVLPATAMPGIINPRLLKLSLNQALIAPAYAAYLLQSAWAKHYFKLQAHGGTMEILNLGIIKALPVPLPALDEQHRIVAEVDRRLSLLRETEAQVGANLRRAERMRQSILASAFSGQIRTGEANWQMRNDLGSGASRAHIKPRY